MSRLGALFIVVCMVLVAASVGAVLFLLVGLNGTVSAMAALAVLTVLAIYQSVTARVRDRSELGAQIADLSRGTADLALQVGEIGRRAAAVQGQLDHVAAVATENAYAATETIATELSDLGNLVKQLAESVAVCELKLAGTRNFAANTERDAAPPPPVLEKRDEAGPPERNAPPAADTEAAKDRMLKSVREAVAANRTELYLQPIVTLPQRKVRYYEAFTWLRAEDGTLLQPAEFLGAAEAGGLMPQIDNLLLFRSIQVIRRLQLKNRDIGLFCGISASTLNDAQSFPQILQFMDANRALGPSFVLQFQQKALLGMGPLESEGLAALRDLGFRFCIDQVTDLRLDPRDLGERGICYVKVPAALLLGQAGAPRPDIHAADLSDLLGRFGISLIAERIEAEVQVVDLLEYDVRFGQGALFSPPRPVRAEALRGTAGAADTASRDGADKARDKTAAGRSSGIAL